MKLTPEQIDQLYTFTIQHYVEYYDLQTELVDHLANAIEQQWQEDPNISFEDALQVEFKKFGVFGFMDVVEEKQKVLSKKYNRVIWKHFITFFKIPKIVLTALSIMLVYWVLNNISFNSDIFFAAYLLVAIFAFRKMFLQKQKLEKRKASLEKTWLFEEMIITYGNSPLAFILLFQILNHLGNHSDSGFHPHWVVLIYSIFLVFFIIFIYIIQFIIPAKAEEYLKETYPEYEISK